MTAGFGYPRSARILAKKQYDKVFQGGRKKVRPSLVVYYLASETESQLGLAVSRKVGGAVQRNLVRRRLKELFRLHRPLFTAPHELVVVGRAGAAQLPFERLRDDFLSALRSAGVLPREESAKPESAE